MFDVVIGAGQGGSRIGKAVGDKFNVPVFYVNLNLGDTQDITKRVRHLFCPDEGGSGRDSVEGEKLVKKHGTELSEFLGVREIEAAEHVCLCVGGGGGSGVGFLFPILSYLSRRKKKCFVIFALPQKRERMPAEPNALRAVNRLIDSLAAGKQVHVMLVDNDHCKNLYGQDRDYWSKVNDGIASVFNPFLEAMEADQGYSTLDERELLRVLFFQGGFVDVRKLVLPEQAIPDMKEIRTSSLLCGGMDYRTTKAAIFHVVVPKSRRFAEDLGAFLDELFEFLAKKTRTTFVLNSVSYEAVKNIQVHMCLAGQTRAHALDKHLKSAQKLSDNYRQSEDVQKLDLEGLI